MDAQVDSATHEPNAFSDSFYTLETLAEALQISLEQTLVVSDECQSVHMITETI